jgi:hypothetical protein
MQHGNQNRKTKTRIEEKGKKEYKKKSYILVLPPPAFFTSIYSILTHSESVRRKGK